MKRFSFNLKGLLGLREWEERVAQQNLSRATQSVVELETRIRQLGEEQESICEYWNESSATSFSRNDRIALQGRMEQTRVDEKALRESLSQAKAEREKALSALTQAMRKKKIVEDLKQRRLEAHRSEVARLENLEVEDIYNARTNGRSGL